VSGPDRGNIGDLERLLEGIRFEPRQSLGAEILGRWRRGERPEAGSGWGLSGFRLRLLLGGGLLLVAVALAYPGAPRTVDRCCLDLDGGGQADDGLLVVSRRGTEVKRLAVYEDRDGSGSYTAADLVRFDRAGRPGLIGAVESGSRTVEFCCLDYDGGGPSDDALVVVGRAPDVITMAAIYERGGRTGVTAPLR
jgi:hypothetical protein